MKIILLLSFSLLVSCSSVQKSDQKTSQKIEQEKANLYLSIGKSFEENKLFEKAIENYQEALKIDGTHSETHFVLGKLLLKRQFIKEGLSHLESAVDADDKYTEARNFLASYNFYKFKKYKVAKDLIDQSIKDLTYTNQEETWSLKLKLDLILKGRAYALKSVPKVMSLPKKSCAYRLDIAQTLYKMSMFNLSLSSSRAANDLCLSSREKNKIAYLKGLIFIKKKNLLVAEKIFNGIDAESDSLKKKLNKAQSFVRKQINDGI